MPRAFVKIRRVLAAANIPSSWPRRRASAPNRKPTLSIAYILYMTFMSMAPAQRRYHGRCSAQGPKSSSPRQRTGILAFEDSKTDGGHGSPGNSFENLSHRKRKGSRRDGEHGRNGLEWAYASQGQNNINKKIRSKICRSRR